MIHILLIVFAVADARIFTFRARYLQLHGCRWGIAVYSINWIDYSLYGYLEIEEEKRSIMERVSDTALEESDWCR